MNKEYEQLTIGEWGQKKGDADCNSVSFFSASNNAAFPQLESGHLIPRVRRAINQLALHMTTLLEAKIMECFTRGGINADAHRKSPGQARQKRSPVKE